MVRELRGHKENAPASGDGLRRLPLASIVALTAIDSVYVARRVISPIYLLDAVVEIGLLVAWAMFLTMW